MTYLAAAPRTPVTGKAGHRCGRALRVLHERHEVVLTLSGPKGADNVDPWRIVTDSRAVDGMTARLEADSLYRFFHAGDDETLALRGVSLRVAAGELVAVTGPSGSGKSTLLACLAGLDEPDGGMVRIDGERLSRRPEEERARMRARRDRHALPAGEPGRPPDGRRQRRAGAAARRRRAGDGRRDALLERCGLAGRARRPPAPALRRRARARRPGGRAGQRPAGAARRRADRRARRGHRAPRPRAAARPAAERAPPSSSSPTAPRSPRWPTARSGCATAGWRHEPPDRTALVRCEGAARTYGSGADGDRRAPADRLRRSMPATAIALVGPSGSGKSTLLHLLAGLDAPTRRAPSRGPRSAPDDAAARPGGRRLPGAEPAAAADRRRERRAAAGARRRRPTARPRRRARGARPARARRARRQAAGGDLRRPGAARRGRARARRRRRG